MARRIYLYDSTLRDGAQTNGVDFTAADKESIAHKLDHIGIDYIEGGWPGANPTDDAFFAHMPKTSHAIISAFGMTRRPSTTADNDPGLNEILNSGATSVCLVGKSWDFHVTKALGTTLKINVDMVRESIEHVVSKKREALFDTEHFFDGFKANKAYALKVITNAYEAGARWIVLCDTNGGTLPHEIYDIVTEVCTLIPGENIGIHCHNDTENAVANSLAAVQAGACQIQGTINGVGERCGNTNLISVIPTLMLKMGLETGIKPSELKHLTKLSRFLDDRLNRPHHRFAPYVGDSAFAHKGGLHVSAVTKNPSSYEHIDPEQVGNRRHILVSDQSGRANIIARLKEAKINPDDYSESKINTLIDEIKSRESKGYAYDNADASFEILAHTMLKDIPNYFRMESFRIIDERSWNSNEELIVVSEATAHLNVKNELVTTTSSGNGPVNALDQAIRKSLRKIYPCLEKTCLVDYRVRIVNSSEGTEAITRVLIETEDETGARWTTIGVSSNIIDASYNALRDSLVYKLMNEHAS